MEQFLPTPSHGGRPVRLLPKFCEYHFYPRPHMEGDLHHSYQRRQFRHFYPRPHMEGDGYTKTVKGISLEFLPTPSHGGRLLPVQPRNRAGGNFYPRPHMEGDCFLVTHLQFSGISTHALTWRATWRLIWACRSTSFLPTPSHGGRRSLLLLRFSSSYFYPRPHMEGDLAGAVQGGMKSISTHALTWRATVIRHRKFVRDLFLPTPSHGGRRGIPLTVL